LPQTSCEQPGDVMSNSFHLAATVVRCQRLASNHTCISRSALR
jgi:hypothetical protein